MTTSKNIKNLSPSLATEIFIEIFQHVTEKPTLFSCMLVNRQWCVNVAPILWRSPLSKSTSVGIIDLLIGGLATEAKERLIRNGIEILPPPPETRAQIFQYASFIRTLKIKYLLDLIEEWLVMSEQHQYENLWTQISYVFREICAHIFQTSESLEELVMDLSHNQVVNIRVQHFFFPEFPGADRVLRRIHKIQSCEYFWKENLYTELSNTCNLLTHIRVGSKSIHQSGQSVALIKFIGLQSNLQHVHIERQKRRLSQFLMALDGSANSLRTLMFSCVNFATLNDVATGVLVKCTHLRSLDFYQCTHSNSANLVKAVKSFKELRYFSWGGPTTSLISHDLILAGLETAQSNLEFLALNTISTAPPDTEIIESIISYGENLRFLQMPMSKTQQVQAILQACPKLVDFIFTSHEKNTIRILDVIGDVIPPTLRHFRANILGVRTVPDSVLAKFIDRPNVNLKTFHINMAYLGKSKLPGICSIYSDGRVKEIRSRYIPKFGTPNKEPHFPEGQIFGAKRDSDGD